MNRWLMPFLLIGLVSTIALSTLSPLVPHSYATAQPVESPNQSPDRAPNRSPKHPLPTAVKPIVQLPTPVRTPVRQFHLPTPVVQLPTPAACHVATPTAACVPPVDQIDSAKPSAPVTNNPELDQSVVDQPQRQVIVAVAELINHQRAQVGLTPLSLAATLSQAGATIERLSI